MSVRRQIRLKKEFLYKKHQDTREVSRDIKKRKLEESLSSGKAIPTEILSEARELYHELDMDVKSLEEKEIDDEYSSSNILEPKVCLTTSRDPSSRLKQFVKEVKLLIPNSTVINRGTTRTDELVESCRSSDFSDLIIINETRGQPDGLSICHLPFGPTVYFTIKNCVLRHDIPDVKPVSQVNPHLIFENLNTKIGQRVAKILQSLYPIPKEENKRVISFVNNNDFISIRHHTYAKKKNEVSLNEVGPRFDLLPYEVSI